MMANTDAAAEVSNADVQSSDEFIPSLKHLQELQNQLDNLRQALPKMINSFTPPPTSNVTPSRMYHEFATAAYQTVREIKQLRESWESQDTASILQRTKQSLEKDSEMPIEFEIQGRFNNIPELQALSVEDGEGVKQEQSTDTT